MAWHPAIVAEGEERLSRGPRRSLVPRGAQGRDRRPGVPNRFSDKNWDHLLSDE